MPRMAVLLLAAPLAACIGAPTMVPATQRSPGPLAPDRARVVFFRPSWEASPLPFEHHAQASWPPGMTGTVVVDERGDVLGAVEPGTYVVADLRPGEHAFFAEDAHSVDDGCVTDCLGVGAALAHLAPGRTYGVLVEHPNRLSIGDRADPHRLDLLRADGAPLGRDGWTWLVEEDGADWAREHADRVNAMVEGGTERMRHSDEWSARESSIGP